MRSDRAFKLILRILGGLLFLGGLGGLFYTLHLCTGGYHSFNEPVIHRMMAFSVIVFVVGAVVAFWLPERATRKFRENR